jgi:hypothetical protein
VNDDTLTRPQNAFEMFRLAQQYQHAPPARKRVLTEAEMDAIDVEEALRTLSDPNEVPIPFAQVCKDLGIE